MIGSPDGLSFAELHNANSTRVVRWHEGATPWTVLEWGGAMAGEAGEACNLAKKIRRLDQGIYTKDFNRGLLLEKLAEECADTVIYLELLCASQGIDLGAAIRKKFNETSIMFGFPERL